mmetsp:Transcript_11352/g.34220  ORF Transcript_11352/g.34220 Transcript_11352/m.34220 type:complete len:234 (-) Transcript_11352:534-1235(-)
MLAVVSLMAATSEVTGRSWTWIGPPNCRRSFTRMKPTNPSTLPCAMIPCLRQTAETGCPEMRLDTTRATVSVVPSFLDTKFHLAAKALPRAADWTLIRLSSPTNLQARTINFVPVCFPIAPHMADIASSSQIIAPEVVLQIRQEPSFEAVATKWLLSEKQQSVMGAACAGEQTLFKVQLNLPRASDTVHIRSIPSSPPAATRSSSASTAQELSEGSVIFMSDTYMLDATKICF